MIFVNIASYADFECDPTVRDLFAKARNPAQLRVVVVVSARTKTRELHTLLPWNWKLENPAHIFSSA